MNLLRFILKHPLNRGRRLHSLRRFLAWQIGAHLVPGPVVIDFVNSAKLLVRPSMTGATGNIYVGLHEFEDMAFVLHFLRQGDLFADIGANVGSYTVLAASAGANVVAFEPGNAAFQWLKQNIALNDISGRVSAHRVALGSRSANVSFTSNMDTVNHVVTAGSPSTSATQLVAMTTLDSILDGRCPALIKIDVEGFETEVLRGATSTLANLDLQCIIMELNGSGVHYGFNENTLMEKMIELGFDGYSYAPFERRLIQRTASNSSGNMLFVRNLTYVQHRLHEAPAFSVQDWKI